VTQFEKALTRRLPDVTVDDRIVHLGTVKRVGHARLEIPHDRRRAARGMVIASRPA
jgi:hypothetical protein